MGRAIIDLLFSITILIGIILNYIVKENMTVAEFYIALMLNYFGSRYLLMSDLDYAIYEAALGSDDE